VAGALFPGVQLGWLYRELAAKMEEELDFQVSGLAGGLADRDL
jgi:hypothetical protein